MTMSSLSAITVPLKIAFIKKSLHGSRCSVGLEHGWPPHGSHR
jgi:hypothetical protein